MAWALLFDGVNDYCSHSTITIPSSTTFDIEFIFAFSNSNFGRPFGTTSGFTSRALLFHNTQEIRLTDSSGVNAIFTAPTYTRSDYNKFRFNRNGSNTVECFLNDSSIGTVASWTGSISFNQIGRQGMSTSVTSAGGISELSITVGGSLVNKYDATASSHASGTPILLDTVGFNDATGVNMPTDGSAWLNLDPGGSIAALRRRIEG